MTKLIRLFAFISALLAACGATPPADTSGEAYNPAIDPANFTTTIDNPFFPLIPGTKFTFEGETDEGFERIEVLVTQETREVMGVSTVVVRDTVWIDGAQAEDTYDWYAQDLDGNVWYFGEQVKDYANGQVVSSAGSWEAGVDGALPGVVMWAEPLVGKEYQQEYYAGEAEDMGKVIAVGQSITVPFGSFSDCIVTEDWTPLEPGYMEQKTYCSGVGTVKNEYVQGGSGSQELIALETE